MRRLTKKISVKCDPAWHARLEDKARRSRLSLSEVVRQAVDAAEITAPPSTDLHEVSVQLIRLGTLYNQTVKLAHQTRYRSGSIPVASILEQLETHKATLEMALRVLTEERLRSR